MHDNQSQARVGILSDFVVEVKNLSKNYGDLKAVNDISFGVSKGEIFGILGPNGAGKTTTLEILEGLRKPTSGNIRILGKYLPASSKAIKQQIGVQLQASSFFDYLTTKETLDVFGSFYKHKTDSSTLIKEVSLESKAKTYVINLSGGQKQRLAIAKALINDPELIFLDEPTTGLDPQARRNLWDLIELIRTKGKSLILTTHYMDEAEYLCDRVAIMDEGKIKDIETPQNLIKKQGVKNLEEVFLSHTGKSLRE